MTEICKFQLLIASFKKFNEMKRTIFFITGIFVFLILLPVSITWGQTISAKVTAVEQGDIINVLYKDRTLKITLHGIDCPKTSQAYGQKARQFTSRTVLNQSVLIEIYKRQTNTEYVGNVILAGGAILSQMILKKGLATWDYKNAPDDIILQSLQSTAKDMGVGMWSKPTARVKNKVKDIRSGKKIGTNNKKSGTQPWKLVMASPLFLKIIKISILIIIFIVLVFIALQFKKRQRTKTRQRQKSSPPPKPDTASPMDTGKESPPDFKQAEEAIESNKQAIQVLLNDLSHFVSSLVEDNSSYDTKMTHHKASIKTAMTMAGVEETKRLLLLEIDQIQTNSNQYQKQLNHANNTINEQKKVMAEIQVNAKLDFLTKLINRRAFDEILQEEFERTKRYGGTFSLAMLDIDFFKKVNDKYGHVAGDKTLQLIAKLLREQTRVNDSVGRFGGEEFIILLPQTAMDKARILMEKIRKKVQDSTIIRDGNKIKVTISIGVGEVNLPSETTEKLIKRVDAALYQAKKSGRNLVIVDQSKNSLNS